MSDVSRWIDHHFRSAPRASEYEGLGTGVAESLVTERGHESVVLRLPLREGTGFNLDYRENRVWLLVEDDVVQRAFRC